MNTKYSCTADVTSDIGRRVEVVLVGGLGKVDDIGAKQISDVQSKIEELKQQGLLKRQEYAAASNSDFQRIFSKRP